MASPLRVAFRRFSSDRTFTALTVAVLGLGFGAATVVFSVVDAVVLRPLPYDAPDRLVMLWDANLERGLTRDPVSPVNFMDYRALPVFADAAAWWRPGVNLTDPGLDPVRVNAIEVSANLFHVLGVRPQLGAGFPREPFFHPSELVAVISDRLWRTRYAGDPAVIGRQLQFNGRPYTIAGVMPATFHYPDDVDVWQRVRWDYRQHSRAAHFMEAVARLADGASLSEAQSAAGALALRLQDEFGATNKGWTTRLVPLLEDQLGYYRPALIVVFGAAGLLLTIGCLNVATLLLTRAISRDREMAVRIALGASPRHILGQLFTESAVLSGAGAAAAVLVAAALPAIIRLLPVQIPRIDEAGLDLRVLALSLTLAAATTMAFGLVPALVVLRNATGRMRAGDRGSSRTARRMYTVLVAGEIAVASALLVSASLLVKTVARMLSTPTGVEAEDVVITTVQLATPSTYAQWQRVGDTYTRVLDGIRGHRGVAAAGGTNFLPLEVGWRFGFAVDGQPRPARPEDAPQAQMHSVSDGYFEAMGAELVSGRRFTRVDTAASAPVVVVNETFARRYLPAGPAVGRVLVSRAAGVGPLGRSLPHREGGEPVRYEVVGVVRDIRNAPLGQPVEPAIYFTTQQFPFRELYLAVRASDAATAVAATRAALIAAAPGVPMGQAETWRARFGGRTAHARLLMGVLGLFGSLAAVLAAVGVHGLFAWSVAIRRRELAIRLTLGAAPSRVAGSIVARGASIAVLGIAGGIILVRIAENGLARVLYQVAPGDVGASASACAVLLASALLACLLPALRAMHVDPADGLRAE